MLGVSHGALQFMTYEEMKNRYNQHRKRPIDAKLVSGAVWFGEVMPGVDRFRLPFSDHRRVFDVCRRLEADCCGDHLPVPGDTGPSAGSQPQLQGHLGLHQGDMEVRKSVRVLQGPYAVLSPCHAQHLPRDVDL